jgi:xanthine dehydrogenase accessory factor
VLDAARAVLAGAAPHVLEVSPGDQLLPWEDAPACAGVLRVLVTPAPGEPVHTMITDALAADRDVTVGVELQAPFRWSIGGPGAGFVERVPARRRLVLVGATDLAAVLATLAESVGRAVTVVDPRPGHLASGAFPASATLVRAWPDEGPVGAGDAVVVLSHDPRIDDRGIVAALAAGAEYVAALGSRATHAQRLLRLAGTPGLERLSGPAGLDLGGGSIAETAVSILAELVAVENGRTGGRLRDAGAPIRAETGILHNVLARSFLRWSYDAQPYGIDRPPT